ncbi:MAG TPA: LCP family protein [Tissierellaceae bacterium]
MKKRFLATFLISILLFSSLYFFLWSKFIDKNVASAGSDISDENSEDDETGSINVKGKNEIMFLMVGVDANDVANSKGTRTDTMMLVKVDFENGDIDLLSLPRDSRVVVRGKEDKLNHAHAYGGMPLTIDTVRDFLGVDLEYYVKVDYKAVKSIVDAIGGVKLNVPQRMRYSDPTAKPPLNINLQPGEQTLDGQKAHDFLRFRSYPDGDLGRVKAQQYFLEEFIKQTLQPKNIIKLPTMVKTYYDYVDTNISLDYVLKGMGVANKLNMENVRMETIQGYNKRINGLDYLIYDRESTKEIVEEMFSNYLIN